MNDLDITKYANIHSSIKDKDVAHLVIGLNKVVASNTVKGLKVDVEEQDEGVDINLNLAGGTVITKPVHMCFGLLQEQGIQKINLKFDIGENSRISVMAHCVFPNAEDISHIMNAEINVAANAHYEYLEKHIHSPQGGIKVIPKAKVNLGEGATYKTDFELLEGRVGLIDLDYETFCAKKSTLEMNAKISGQGDDEIKIREIGHLNGEYARGVLTSRIAVRDQAKADIYNKLTASAAFARGHVDCKEIIKDNAKASAVPIVEVNNPKAHITHEAALGSVDTKQLQTLMARGLTEEQASDMIIEGLLS
jgi:hypothetical protein